VEGYFDILPLDTKTVPSGRKKDVGDEKKPAAAGGYSALLAQRGKN